MSAFGALHRWVVLTLVVGTVVGLVAAGFAVWGTREGGRTSEQRGTRERPSENALVPRRDVPQDIPPVPEPAASPFLNAAAGNLVGMQKCVSCHEDEYASFSETPHSQALATIDPAREPGDAEFFHRVSGRWYRVYRQDGKLRHRESIRLEGEQEMLLADYAMDYVIGSGHHSRSYLYEVDGFMMESPLTWYASTGKWGMSPGYDEDPDQPGFAREVRVTCVYCHSGQVESRDGSTHRLSIHEAAVGCERCHGPGSLHVARHETGRGAGIGEESEDRTIANPRYLTRERADDVCGQCHLATIAQVDVRGRHGMQFRPGQRLVDFRVNYQLSAHDQAMSVVGHVEQMRQSRCYTESQSLTCLTCHDPHRAVPPSRRVEHYRQKCLTCHTDEACGLEPSHRREREPDDNCVACHMPVSGTDIPHFSFTHHRIAVRHPTEVKETDMRPEELSLVPMGDVSHFSRLDQERNLGLAYMAAAESVERPDVAREFRRRAVRLLEGVVAEGMADAEVESALALYYWKPDPARCIAHARRALALPDLSPKVRRDAQSVLGAALFDTGQVAGAIAALKERTRIQRAAEPWMLLALCHQRLGDHRAAIASALKAAEIEPDRPDLQELLTRLYLSTGDRASAQEHEKRRRILLRAKASAGS